MIALKTNAKGAEGLAEDKGSRCVDAKERVERETQTQNDDYENVDKDQGCGHEHGRQDRDT